jgi:Cytochrome oxidase complex assembly protein 1
MSSTPPANWPAPPGFNPSFQSRPKSWFRRNLAWLVPAIIAAFVALIASFVFGILTFVHTVFVSSYPYKAALARANASAEVAAKIGTPVHVGWLISGSINTSTSSGNATMGIPISGPQGKGQLIVVAKEQANHWTFLTLQVNVEGQDQPILLSGPDSKAPAETPGDSI